MGRLGTGVRTSHPSASREEFVNLADVIDVFTRRVRG
jgi:hypothetical protein